MNAAVKASPMEILVNSIQTRTIVGFKYGFALPGGVKVALDHITYAPSSFQDQLGIKGKAQLPSGQVLNVACSE